MNNQILKPIDFFQFLQWYGHLCHIDFCFPWTDWTLQIYNEGSLRDSKKKKFHVQRVFTILHRYKIGTEGPSEDKEFTLKFRLWEPALPVVGVVAS